MNEIDKNQIVNIKWYSVKDSTPIFTNTDDKYRCYNESDELLIIANGEFKIGYYRETNIEYGSKWCDEHNKRWILQGRDGYSCDNVTHFAYMNFNRPEKE